MLTLVINAGSSSLKAALFDQLEKVWSGQIEEWEEASAKEFLRSIDCAHVERVGHRFVHGGTRFTKPTLLDAETLSALERLNPLAPLHNPRNLLGVKVAQEILPHAKQIAVFDTAFHATIPRENYLYALPEKYTEKGIRRFGFHGLSHASCIDHLKTLLGTLPRRVISCHLGSGCSIAAVLEGRSVDTTMGFTPMEGMIMGSRSGSIDPGIAFYLYREGIATPDLLDQELNNASGLLGLCGTQDMRIIEKNVNQEPYRLAFDLFARSCAKEIARMAVSLGGIDALLFTGGIGENSPLVREKVASLLPFLSLSIDPLVNEKNEEGPLSSDRRLFKIKSREAEWIAQSVQTI